MPSVRYHKVIHTTVFKSCGEYSVMLTFAAKLHAEMGGGGTENFRNLSPDGNRCKKANRAKLS